MMFEQVMRSYKPPFTRTYGYVYDSDHNTVADGANCTADKGASLRVRGWGRLQYLGNARGVEALQDTIGDSITQALTNHWRAGRAMVDALVSPTSTTEQYVLRSTDGTFLGVVTTHDPEQLIRAMGGCEFHLDAQPLSAQDDSWPLYELHQFQGNNPALGPLDLENVAEHQELLELQEKQMANAKPGKTYKALPGVGDV